MALLTTTIGAYPKPDYVPVHDWFEGVAADAGKRKQVAGLMANWSDDYEDELKRAGAEAEELFRRATEEVVGDQALAGIDVPTDGEVRRENYIYYQLRHMKGVDFDHLTERSVRDGAFTAKVPTITGPVRAGGPFLRHDWKVAQSFTDRPVKITLPGPMTIADSIANEHYENAAKLGADLATALNAEIRALAEAGCRYIQVDEPVFARKPDEAVAHGVENLERCFEGVPEAVTRVVHMCCGYPNRLDYDDYHKAEPRSYFAVSTAVDEAAVDQVSIEDAHRHNDLRLLENFKQTTVILGVVDVAKSRVEDVDEIRERLKQALGHIDPARLMAAPDCGLGLLNRALALAKLANLCQAAQSVSS